METPYWEYYQPAINRLSYYLPFACMLGADHVKKTPKEALLKEKNILKLNDDKIIQNNLMLFFSYQDAPTATDLFH
eukprot:14674806-Ditylum_brightwellii.AAC.1